MDEPPPSLKKYREKRDPATTNEPFATDDAAQSSSAEATGGTRSGAYVVHLHHATRLHYDLRIQMGHALLSFAVPHGPSLDPDEKHLAVRTEEHPLEYLDFEAVIPKGNYGAGPMICWDRGAVRYLESSAEDGLAAGKLDFTLSGYKLRGRFALVKLKDDQSPNAWLLIKKTDAHSNKDSKITVEQPRSVLSGLTVDELELAEKTAADILALAVRLGAKKGDIDGRTVQPMLCATLEGATPIPTSGYIAELKLDGVRVIADKRDEEVELTYRSNRDTTPAYPEVARAVKALVPERVVLDGEIVAFDDEGLPNFQKLAQRIHLSEKWNVERAMLACPVVYLVFDVLQIGDRVTTDLPLVVRRELVKRIVPGTGVIRALDWVDGHITELLDFCRARKLEGVVAKKADSPYRMAKRTNDWIKIKCERDESFVVIGWTVGNDGRARLGALDLGSYDEDGTLVVRGKVGSGLSEKTIDALLPRLEAMKIKEKLFIGPLDSAPNGRMYVRPEIVVSVRYLGWSDDGRLRFPTFRGIDPDRAPKDCHAAPHDDKRVHSPSLEAPRFQKEAALRAEGVQATSDGVADGKPASSSRRSHPVKRAQLTNQDKIFWPEEKYTKGDLCRYYERISNTILPYLRDRPVVIVRYPDGIGGKNFFQWNVPWGFPAWMRHIPLDKKDMEGKKKRVFLVNDVESLLTVINLGCIPMHVLAKREFTLDQCDWCTIDFDVQLSTFANGTTIALALKEILDRIGLPSYPKTSGQTGLHVLYPMGPGVGFETAQTLTVLLGKILAQRFPEIGTMERADVKKRGNRVYIDVFQTHDRKTIVAPYSVRAFKGARVSTPVTWDELRLGVDPGDFTIRTVPDRLEKLGDPMRKMLDDRPDIPSAVAKLGAIVTDLKVDISS